jgi:hypothetical protein
MPLRLALFAILFIDCSFVVAQGYDVGNAGASSWQSPPNGAGVPAAYAQGSPAGGSAAANSPVTPTPNTPQITHAQVTKGSGALPSDHGQVWREYDITPYTMRVQNTTAPEQAIVDWILRETGYEAWHSTPVGLLSADKKTLRVYHTPDMQAIVADIVDRFVNNLAENHGFGLRVVTIDSPNWRTKALPLMQSVPVQSPGVQGWILAKEDAALLVSELKRRSDYREHNAPHQLVQNGSSLVISTMRPITYTKGVFRTQQTWPGFQPEMGQFDEGFSMEFSPLLSLDTKTVDAVVKLKLTQVEKFYPVQIDVPSPVAQNQRTECQVPQMTMVQLHERFRWPTDQVLLLSMGVVAQPGPAKPNFITDNIPILKSPPRADALLFVESRGANSTLAVDAAAAPQTASRPNQTYHGRY